jgi:putative transcriptional regulator
MEKPEYLQKIGENIVRLRKIKNLTQFDLACKVDIEASALRRIEKGRVNSTIWMLKRVADELEVNINELLP